MFRKAAVKGYFYPDSAEELRIFINEHEQKGVEKKFDAKMVIVPHAGYVYSGATAVKTLSHVLFKDKILLLGPNHTGFGETVSLYPVGEWETPFGNVKIDEVLNEKLKRTSIVEEDILAHVREHSLEVIMPIIKYFKEEFTFSAITMMPLKLEQLLTLAQEVYENIKDEDVTVVVSSDFNHYEDADTTERKDILAIERILQLDSRGLYDVVFSNDISMCGIYPAILGIELAKRFGAKDAFLVEHTHSGKINGDYSQVVGYAGIIIY